MITGKFLAKREEILTIKGLDDDSRFVELTPMIGRTIYVRHDKIDAYQVNPGNTSIFIRGVEFMVAESPDEIYRRVNDKKKTIRDATGKALLALYGMEDEDEDLG
jgi:uncharacterized protein YlzI (FlbEa/FlbD family)